MTARTLLNVFLIGALGLPAQAFATLGEPVDSVHYDQRSMRAAGRSILNESRYTVHEIQTPSGTLVREYATQDGVIFAVAWEGPTLPDIKHLLGKYFDRYTSALQEQRGRRGHAFVSQPELVVQSGGRLRAFSGHAYIPQLLPQGVTPDELQ